MAFVSAVLSFFKPRGYQFSQAVGTAVFTFPHLLGTCIYTASDLLTLGTDVYFTKSLNNFSRTSQYKLDVNSAHFAKKLIKIFRISYQARVWDNSQSKATSDFLEKSQVPKNKNIDSRIKKAIGPGRLIPDNAPSRVWDWILSQQLRSNDYYLKGSILNLRARVFNLTSGAALAIVGIACTALGAIAALFAILTFGQFNTLNDYAINLIGMLGFSINQLHQGIIGFFRPVHLVSPSLLEKNHSKH